MNIKTHGKSIFIVCCLLILALLGGNSMALARDPGTVIYLSDGDFPDWDPAEGLDEESMVFCNVYETLVYYNPAGSKEMLRPGLATSWEKSADGLTWTFHLRKGVKFSDGSSFTAAAVKYSIERNRDSKKGAYYIWASLKEVKVIDDYTVQFITKEAVPIDLIATAGYSAYIYSPNVEEKGGRDWFMKGNALGTGPYKVDHWTKDQEIVMIRNADYWGGWGDKYFDKIIIKRVLERSTRVQMMKAGEADMAIRIPTDTLPSMKKNPNIEVLSFPSWTNVYMRLNKQKFPTDNLKVRQAIQHAFDRKTVVESIYNGYAEVAEGPVPSTIWGHNSDLKQYEFDLEKAKKLFEESGIPKEKIKLQGAYYSSNQEYTSYTQLLQANLRKIGIEMELTPGVGDALTDQQRHLETSYNISLLSG